VAPAPTSAPSPRQFADSNESAPKKQHHKRSNTSVGHPTTRLTPVALSTPVGGVQAGGGGTAPRASSGANALVLGLGGGALVLLAGGSALVGRGRRQES
jgi:hypothetical protein